MEGVGDRASFLEDPRERSRPLASCLLPPRALTRDSALLALLGTEPFLRAVNSCSAVTP